MGIRDELTGQAEKSLKRWQHLLLEVTDRSLNGMKILKKQIHITVIFPSSMSCIREEGLPRKHRSFMRLREPVFTEGDAGTGWSLAWKILMWARMKDGVHTGKLMNEILHLVEPKESMNMANGGRSLCKSVLCPSALSD